MTVEGVGGLNITYNNQRRAQELDGRGIHASASLMAGSPSLPSLPMFPSGLPTSTTFSWVSSVPRPPETEFMFLGPSNAIAVNILELVHTLLSMPLHYASNVITVSGYDVLENVLEISPFYQMDF